MEEIDLKPYIGQWIEQVVVGGEPGKHARICDFEWLRQLYFLCSENNISFWFKQTGSKFVKGGKLYNIRREFQHSQARKSGLNF